MYNASFTQKSNDSNAKVEYVIQYCREEQQKILHLAAG